MLTNCNLMKAKKQSYSVMLQLILFHHSSWVLIKKYDFLSTTAIFGDSQMIIETTLFMASNDDQNCNLSGDEETAVCFDTRSCVQ